MPGVTQGNRYNRGRGAPGFLATKKAQRDTASLRLQARSERWRACEKERYAE